MGTQNLIIMRFIKNSLLILPAIALSVSVFSQTGNNTLSGKEKDGGWILLFDGKTSTGWTKSDGSAFPGKGWLIKDGCLSLQKDQPAGDIITVAEYSDFELSFDFLMSPACNSGVKYFYYNYPKGGSLGMEYQLLDDKLGDDNKIDSHLCGSLYDIFAPDKSQVNLNPPGQWNSAKIISRGRHTEHWMNGKKILEFERGSDQYLTAVAKSKYKTEPVFGMVEKGHILLQDHGHEISFRNIKILEFKK